MLLRHADRWKKFAELVNKMSRREHHDQKKPYWDVEQRIQTNLKKIESWSSSEGQMQGHRTHGPSLRRSYTSRSFESIDVEVNLRVKPTRKGCDARIPSEAHSGFTFPHNGVCGTFAPTHVTATDLDDLCAMSRRHMAEHAEDANATPKPLKRALSSRTSSSISTRADLDVARTSSKRLKRSEEPSEGFDEDSWMILPHDFPKGYQTPEYQPEAWNRPDVDNAEPATAMSTRVGETASTSADSLTITPSLLTSFPILETSIDDISIAERSLETATKDAAVAERLPSQPLLETAAEDAQTAERPPSQPVLETSANHIIAEQPLSQPLLERAAEVASTAECSPSTPVSETSANDIPIAERSPSQPVLETTTATEDASIAERSPSTPVSETSANDIPIAERSPSQPLLVTTAEVARVTAGSPSQPAFETTTATEVASIAERSPSTPVSETSTNTIPIATDSSLVGATNSLQLGVASLRQQPMIATSPELNPSTSSSLMQPPPSLTVESPSATQTSKVSLLNPVPTNPDPLQAIANARQEHNVAQQDPGALNNLVVKYVPSLQEIAAWSEAMPLCLFYFRVVTQDLPAPWLICKSNVDNEAEHQLRALLMRRMTEGCMPWPLESCKSCHELGIP